MVKIAKGLKQTYKNAVDIPLDEVPNTLRIRTDCYEVLNDDHNRCYLDIDGKFNDTPITEDQFNQINNETKEALESYLGTDVYILGTSSSYAYRKISFRVVYPTIVMTRKKNKKFAIKVQKEIVLPQHVNIDTGVYGKNQKIRMFYSSKDGENRPMVPVGDVEIVDTLISHIPTDASIVPDEDPVAVVEEEYVPKESNSIISTILEHLSPSRMDDYETWVKIGMICKSEKEPLDTWEIASRRSSKYKRGECEYKWKTFKSDGGMGIAQLWSWLEEDDPDTYQELKQHDYKFQKLEFEKEVFCLNTPPCFIRLTINESNVRLVQPLKIYELQHIYADRKDFIAKWTVDPERLSYERMDMLPRMPVPEGVFNTFRGFPIEFQPIQTPTCDTILHVIANVCNYEENVIAYVLDWFAHLIQKPYEKPGTCLVFKGDQGAGKDTVVDGIIGTMLGNEFHKTTGDAMLDLFGSFNAQNRDVMLFNLQEANFMTNKAKADVLKNLITCPTITVRDKGVKSYSVRSCMRIVMTTNNEVPVVLENTNRRFVLIEASNKYCKNGEFWNHVHKTIPLELRAFYDFLNTRDISNFVPMRFPMTEYHEEVKQSFIPVLAKTFQTVIQSNHEQHVFHYTTNELLNVVNTNGTKFEFTAIQLGKQLKDYIREHDEDKSKPIMKKRMNAGFKYSFYQSEMIEFLKNHNWWVDI
jgi:hypothetical protein